MVVSYVVLSIVRLMYHYLISNKFERRKFNGLLRLNDLMIQE